MNREIWKTIEIERWQVLNFKSRVTLPLHNNKHFLQQHFQQALCPSLTDYDEADSAGKVYMYTKSIHQINEKQNGQDQTKFLCSISE